MMEFYPLLVVGAIAGILSIVFIIAYLSIKDKKEAIGFDRHMKDSEIMKRLLKYAKPYIGSFVFVLIIMLFSIAYDVVSPLLVGNIEEMIKDDFEMSRLMSLILVYAGILIVSLICSYIQAIVLQKTGQKILSSIREDLFVHIESLSHAQLTEHPVGKLVTRVTNDTNAISIMFTNILVNLIKNVFIIVGVLSAMLLLNYQLTLMVLCFVPFIVLFTVIFRKFSRRAYRKVKDGTTDINTFLSENLSGMKITQIFNRQEHKKADPQKQQDIGRVDFEEYTANTKLSGSFSLNKGKLPYPVAQGVVVEQFGVHPHPTLKNVNLPFNNGINISTRPGSSVRVVFDGVVKQVIAIPGYNQCVLVQHGQYFTFYCKLAKVGVKVGDKLSTGNAIGTLESGGSTAILHFELWNGTNKQNPELWLKK